MPLIDDLRTVVPRLGQLGDPEVGPVVLCVEMAHPDDVDRIADLLPGAAVAEHTRLRQEVST